MALGSRAFTGIARAVWHLTRDSENKSRRLLLPGKNNLAREGDGLAFSIIGEPPRISWERDPVAMSADDALAVEVESREQKPGPDAEAFDAASAWLRSAWPTVRDWRKTAGRMENGQGGSDRTLKRAKQSLAVEAYRVEMPGPWWWRLPAKDAKSTRRRRTWPSWPLAENTARFRRFRGRGSKGAKIPELGPLEADNRARVTGDHSATLAELLADCDALGIRLLRPPTAV